MDKKMFLSFFNFANNNKKFGGAARFVASASSFVFAAVYAAFCVYLLYRRSSSIILFCAVPLVNLVFMYIIRFSVKRKRPCIKYNLENRFSQKSSYSFPSNHASSATIIAFACLYVNVAAGLIVFMLAFITMLSRLFTGVHYPSDVIAGFLLGAVAAAVGFSFLPSVLF